MNEICMKYNMKCSWYMHKKFFRYTWNMTELCLIYVFYIPEKCTRYSWDMHDIYMRYHCRYDWMVGTLIVSDYECSVCFQISVCFQLDFSCGLTRFWGSLANLAIVGNHTWYILPEQYLRYTWGTLDISKNIK